MQNSNVLEKSRGIVAFAINTATTDYAAIAQQTVALASRVLDLPYTIITQDHMASKNWHNYRHDVDLGQAVEWKNFGRNLSYDLSPYNETLVMDVDYVIHAAALSSPWGKYSEFEDANLRSQINLIHSVQRSKLIKYIYISTPSMYFDSNNRTNIRENEALPRKFVNAYAHTKRMAELELIQSGLPYVILRPRALTGRGDTVIMPRIITSYKEGKLKIVYKDVNRNDLDCDGKIVDKKDYLGKWNIPKCLVNSDFIY